MFRNIVLFLCIGYCLAQDYPKYTESSPQLTYVAEKYPAAPPPPPPPHRPPANNVYKTPPPTHVYVTPPPVKATTTKAPATYPTAAPPAKPRPVAYNYPERNLPLKGCFYNDHGYACCSKPLQGAMEELADDLLNNGTFHRCNVQKIANKLQEKVQEAFEDDFETVVGLSDFAERVHFRKYYVCKIEVNGRYMLAYSTPEQSSKRLRAKRDYNSEDDEIHEYNF
ncbi:unnamed protein product [Caenorhabditis angaria]|uniref:Ground-like domain-containing protein n=1 Tax=Caenorhabditis angaria TaxID=860376 RepID=A0A9P1J3M4_9PELO|nr:unnamed protein product [Caenorhabditis angaria]